MSYNPIEHPQVLAALPTAPETPSRAYLIEYGEDISADANPAPRIEDRPVEVAPDDPDEVLITQKVPRPAAATTAAVPGSATAASNNRVQLPAGVSPRAPNVNRVPPPPIPSPVVEDQSRVPPPPGVSTTPRATKVKTIVVDPPSPAPINRVPAPSGVNSAGTPPAPETTTPPASRVWAFLANPESIDYTSGQASYSEITAHASSRSELHYSHTTSEVWRLSDLLFDVWCEGKHLKPLLDGARTLIEADVSTGNYEPPTMEFVMGSRRSGPCKVTSLSWEETRWRDGYPAGIRLSLELKRIPFPNRSQNYLDLPAISEASGVLESVALTDRQLEDARTAARIYLEDKLADYAPSVQELVRSGAYTLTPGTDGIVEMKDDAGNTIGVVGQWDGKELRVRGVNSIPIADPAEEEEKSDEAEADMAAEEGNTVNRVPDPTKPIESDK